MQTVHLFFRIIVSLLSLLLVLATAIPLLHSDAWWIRIFDFPRIQIVILILIMMVGYVVLMIFGQIGPLEFVIAAMVGLALIWQLSLHFILSDTNGR